MKSNRNKRGFTLIELLVVVLIIGVLAAVALPQYQRAVEKSRLVQGLTLVKAMYQAAEEYYLANGVWPTNIDDTLLNLAWTGTTEAVPTVAARSNEDWSVQMYSWSKYKGVILTRLTGTYKGGQFQIWKEHEAPNVPTNQIVCGEQLAGDYAISSKGIFCSQLFKGTKLVEGSGIVYSFIQ